MFVTGKTPICIIKVCIRAHATHTACADVPSRCVLLPLLGVKPPQQSLYLLVDSVDEGCNVTEGEQASTSLSGTVAELLAGHHEFFPPWLLLLCSARKQSKAVTKMFTGKHDSYCHPQWLSWMTWSVWLFLSQRRECRGKSGVASVGCSQQYFLKVVLKINHRML